MKNRLIFLMVLALQTPNSSLKAQVLSKWYIVTETMFYGAKLDTNKTLITNYRTGIKETYPFLKTFDSFALDSFAGAIYVCPEGLTFYWINFEPKTREQILAAKNAPKAQVVTAQNAASSGNTSSFGYVAGIDNPTGLDNKKINTANLKITSKALMDLISGFSSVFVIKPPYAIDTKTKEVVGLWLGFRIDVKKSAMICGMEDFVLLNEKTGEEFFIPFSKSGKNFNRLLTCLYRYDIQGGLEKFLWLNNKEGGIDANIDFLKPYFSLMVNNLPKTYQKFIPVPEGLYLGAREAREKGTCAPKGEKNDEDLGERRITVKNE